MSQIRRIYQVNGQVQGVGFRPFVYTLAKRLGMSGSVANDGQGVSIVAQAEQEVIDRFQACLLTETPEMALISSLNVTNEFVDSALLGFSIKKSENSAVQISATPDAAVCKSCLQELFDSTDRRYRYPFINCTHCGPRYSIVTALPYDRINTTMSAFTQCPSCDAEYHDPENRRFHAQANACSVCGPSLELRNDKGQKVNCADPIAESLAAILRGEIVAMKGIGGFHLVCDAQNEVAVERLRERKKRSKKPFAVMAANAESLERWVTLSESTKTLLQTMAAPIVLCPKHEKSDVADSGLESSEIKPLPEPVAPDLPWLGVMLPHSPLHYLLFYQAARLPNGSVWLEQPQDLLLVMTSGNCSGEPLIRDNQQALNKLQGIADLFLLHNRDIETRCDDSVWNGLTDPPALIRRSRGIALQVIALPEQSADSKQSILAVGALLKNTVCLTKGNRAYVSQYIGDLDNPDCCRELDEIIKHMQQLLDVKPTHVVSDMHPDFYSTEYARLYSQTAHIPFLQVQHHHAHVTAVMAEHRMSGPVLGLVLDGFGFGSDGGLWGGELLQVNGSGFKRVSSLSLLPLAGGEKAAKEPWRMAASVLHLLGEGEQITERFSEQKAASIVRQLLEKNIHCPETSSGGRLFDAAAGLLGLIDQCSYESQAAMMLEAAAFRYLENNVLPEEPLLVKEEQGLLNCLPLLKRLSEIDNVDYAAALFHQQLTQGLVEWVAKYTRLLGIPCVVLAGGCFLNSLLRRGLIEQLMDKNIEVYFPEQLPCNDGAISLGQAQAVLARLNSDTEDSSVKVNARIKDEALCV